MKKLILLPIFLSLVISICSQPNLVHNKDYYLAKSKTNRTTGWILLGAGTAAAISGGIGFMNSFQLFKDSPDADTYAVLFCGGVLADIVSIPFFITAGHYNKLAADVSLAPQQIYLPKGNEITFKQTPGIKLTIRF